MAACPKSRPQNGKRQHAEADLSQDDLPSPPSKKFKSTKEHHSASNFSPQFYDSLSKVWLTRRALRELDRRNQIKSSGRARVPARQSSNREDLQRFARFGGPELDDLRGYPEPTKLNHTMVSKRSSRSSRSKSTKLTNNSTSKTSNTGRGKKRSSAYDENFEQYLINNGIYINNRKSKPSNINEIRQRLAQPRPSLSTSRFSEGAFEEFQQINDDVDRESGVMRKVLPIIHGNADIPNEEDQLFTRLISITNNATVDAKPDFYDGEPSESIDRAVREDLSPYIIPTGHRTAPVAPNFFLEVKAPKGGTDVVKRQITYDLSLGARAMYKLQSYAAMEPVFDNKAHTLGTTYHAGAGTLQMYACHVTPSGPGGSPEFHLTQVDSWALTGNPDSYRRGAAALRHGRELAREWRRDLISDANERAQYAEPSTLNSSNHNGISDTTDLYPIEKSQTSTDDLEKPEPSQDELATLLYPNANSFSYLAAPSRPRESVYDDLLDVTKESEISADELALDTPANPTPSKKRLSKGLGNNVSKAPQHATSRHRRRSKR